MTISIEPASLSEMDREGALRRLTCKVMGGQTLTDEEQMESIIFPLAYRKKEENKRSS